MTNDSALGELAPHPTWREMNASEHFVQFYEADTSLLDSLTGFIGTGLAAGEGCIVVATEAHRAELAARLQRDGWDVAAAVARGQYIALDAAELLAQFMSAG